VSSNICVSDLLAVKLFDDVEGDHTICRQINANCTADLPEPQLK
jgi:hypothetical protein